MIMDKRMVDTYLDKAYEAIKKSGMLDKRKVKKAYRSQISSFGAAIAMGSVKAAIAFFAKQGGSDVDRPKILYAIYLTLVERPTVNGAAGAVEALFKGLGEGTFNKDDIVNAAVAVKLAMNLYELDNSK